MSKPWPKSTVERERPARQRSDTKELYRLGDKLLEATEVEALRRESGTHPVPRDPNADGTMVGEAPAQKVDILLWFDEIEEPVRAHAELQGGRLRLRAPLPLLRVGAELHYTVIDSGAAAAARVQRVALAGGPEPATPIIEIELVGEAPAIDPGSAREHGANEAGAKGTTLEDTLRTAGLPLEIAPEPRPDTRGSRWLALLCAGALGIVGGAAGMKRWLEHETAQRIAAEREVAAREIAAVRAAVVPAPMLFRVVPDEVPAPQPVAPPSLLQHDVLPEMDALPAAPPVSDAPPPVASAPAEPAGDGERLPRITVEEQTTTIVIPMRGSGDGLRSYPLTTPGMIVTLPKAFALIPPGSHAPERGLARRIGLRKQGAGTQVKVLYRGAGVRPRVVYDPAVGVEITLQRGR